MKQSLLLYSKTHIWNTGSESSVSYLSHSGANVPGSESSTYGTTKVSVTVTQKGYELARYDLPMYVQDTTSGWYNVNKQTKGEREVLGQTSMSDEWTRWDAQRAMNRPTSPRSYWGREAAAFSHQSRPMVSQSSPTAAPPPTSKRSSGM